MKSNTNKITEIAEYSDIVYYWYYHGIPESEVSEIKTALNEHDYDRFMQYFKKYCGDQLPATAAVFNCLTDKLEDHVDITRREKFAMITHSECECG